MNKNNPAFRFVNGMANIAYLTGFVRKPGDNMFYLQQNNNMDQAIPIHIKSTMRVPADKTPVTVLAHISGDKDGQDLQNAVINAFDIQRPSVRSMPALTTWVKGGGKESDPEDFRPFSSGAGIKPALKSDVAAEVEQTEGFTEDEQILRDILEATRGRLDTRLGDNANVVQLAGFVDSMMWIEPNEFQQNGYGAIMLRQHQDQGRNIPIRLYSPAAKVIMKNIQIGLPISVVGQIRMKTNPDDKTGGKISNLHVRVADIYRVEKDKDIKQTPTWWAEMRDRLEEELRLRKQARSELAKTKAAQTQREPIDASAL